MKPLFISPEDVIRRAYRREKSFKLAGAVVLVFLFLQIGFVYELARLSFEHSSSSSSNRSLRSSVSKANEAKANYASLEKKLSDIHAWEPILKNRLPASALLSIVEQSVPPELVISHINVLALQQNPIRLGAGVYLIPKLYQLTLEGEKKNDSAPELLEAFSKKLLAKLPANAREMSSHLTTEAAEHSGQLVRFQLVLEIPADGNYRNLGLNLVEQHPENL